MKQNNNNNTDERDAQAYCAAHRANEDAHLFNRDASRKNGRKSSCRNAERDGREKRDRHGDRTTLDDVRRLVRLNFGNDCVEWQGSTNSKGYGTISGYGQVKLAHRIMWEFWNATRLPVGFEVDHLCNTKKCINPAHLDAVLPEEHHRRTLKRRRCRTLIG